jgi:hypothetical protein
MKVASKRIWVDLGGRCVCDEHLGYEGKYVLAERPKAKKIQTGMTVWEKMSQEEIDYISNEYCDGGTICEDCRGGR